MENNNLSANLLQYGNVLFDVDTEELRGFRRIRIIELDGTKYLHHMFNGEVLDVIKL